MGEAEYQIEMEFTSYDEAIKQKIELRRFICEGIHAYNFWQRFRSMRDEIISPKGDKFTSHEWFWRGFQFGFPNIYDYLKEIGLADGDYNNALAGKIDFGNSEEDLNNLTIIEEVVVEYHATVWHFADWQPFADFLKKKLGAKNVKWRSDEW